jgi:hypothetical protein
LNSLIDSLKKNEENMKGLPMTKISFGTGSGGQIARDSYPHPYRQEILECELPKYFLKESKVSF